MYVTETWLAKHWVMGVVLAMAVGIAKIATTKSNITLRGAIGELISSVVGGTFVLFLMLSTHVSESLIYAGIMIGAYMGIKSFQLGEEELKKRLNKNVKS